MSVSALHQLVSLIFAVVDLCHQPVLAHLHLFKIGADPRN